MDSNATKNELESYHQILHRPEGVQYHDLPNPRSLHCGHEAPRLSLDAYAHGQNQYQQSPAAAFPAQSSSGTAARWSHNQGHANLTNNPFVLPPPALSQHQHELAQYQDEMEETMFGIENAEHEPFRSNCFGNPGMLQYPGQHAQTLDRKNSHSSTGSKSSTTAVAVAATHSQSNFRDKPELEWLPVPDHRQQSNGLPIAHNVGFMPNHVMDGDAYDYSWSTDGSASVTSESSTGYDGSVVNGFYAHSQPQNSYQQSNTLPDSQRPVWPTTVLSPFEANGPPHWQIHGSDVPQQLADSDGSLFTQTFQPLPTYNRTLLGHAGVENATSIVGMQDAMWHQAKVQVPGTIMAFSGDTRDKDNVLLDCRARGMSYKDIKRQYNFPEAESTLRGRYRTLTKEKKDRVRKPEWTAVDCHLLREAVAHYVRDERKLKQVRTEEDVARLNIPWKDVCSYIVDNGGTYGYGYATAKKKYIALLEQERRNGARRRSLAMPYPSHASA